MVLARRKRFIPNWFTVKHSWVYKQGVVDKRARINRDFNNTLNLYYPRFLVWL